MSPDQEPPEEPNDNRVIRLNRDGDRQSVPEPELHETLQGSRPGTRRIRLTREREQTLRRVGEGEFEATPAALRPSTSFGRFSAGLRHFLIGPPLASADIVHERLGKLKALAVFSSDNLSSAAYATEEMLLVLLLAGTGAFSYALPIAVTIALLVAIVAISYIQLVRAYPRGGGAYDVTRVNVGTAASLLAGSTLCVDFILTVAVSTAAGVAAITSALPELHSVRVEIGRGLRGALDGWQPARHPGVGDDLRHPLLLLHHHVRCHDRRWPLPHGHRR